MAYSSNFNLNPSSGRSRSDSRYLREDTQRRHGVAPSERSSGRFSDQGRSSRISADGRTSSERIQSRSTRTTNRVTVSNKEAYRTSSERVQSPRQSAPKRPAPNAQKVGKAGKAQKQTRALQQTPNPHAYVSRGNTSLLGRLLDIINLLVAAILKLIVLLGKGLGRGFLWIWGKNKIAGGAIVVIVALVCAFVLDTAATGDKIYKGVSVGDVDVAGMTQQQAADAIVARYSEKLASTNVYIFTSEEAAKNTNVEQAQKEEEALAEQTSVEQHLENKVLWVESADTLGARLPAQEMAAEAVNFGRTTGIFDRFSTLMRPHIIEPRVDYNQTIISKLLSDLDIAIGDPVQEFGIDIKEGVASVIEGHDGYMINKDGFVKTLTEKLLYSEVNDPRYIPVAEYISLKVDSASAQKTADAVNEALAEGASFAYNSKVADIDNQTLAAWIETEPAQRRNGEWYLKPVLSETRALTTLTKSLNFGEGGQKYQVGISVEGNGVRVTPNQTITIPSVGAALGALDQVLFGSFCDNGTQRIAGDRYNIAIQTQETAGPLSLDEALAYGVVTKFSSFTTKFNLATSTLNRLYNIQKAADLITDSVVPANGTWSFNETAGDCNTEAGFKDAGVVKDGEMTDAPGGGVCQVATTVFNAVYDAGFSIKERHNHTIQPAAYPAGRDAAIAYPTLDLVWQNNTPSDVLLQTSYDDYSITVDLIGENPERTVTTNTGEWEEGEPYKVKVVLADNYADNAVVKYTNGVDGAAITVVRTVVGPDGTQIEQNTFNSHYAPIHEIYRVGAKVDQAEIERKYARSEDDKGSASSNNAKNDTASGASKKAAA